MVSAFSTWSSRAEVRNLGWAFFRCTASHVLGYRIPFVYFGVQLFFGFYAFALRATTRRAHTRRRKLLSRHYSGQNFIGIVSQDTTFCNLRISRARRKFDARAWALHLVLFRIDKKTLYHLRLCFASVERRQGVEVTRVQRSFCVRAIFVGYRGLYPSGPDNFLPDGLTLRRLGAPPRGDGVRLHQPADFTVYQCKTKALPRNMQSCTPDKCISKFRVRGFGFRGWSCGIESWLRAKGSVCNPLRRLVLRR